MLEVANVGQKDLRKKDQNKRKIPRSFRTNYALRRVAKHIKSSYLKQTGAKILSIVFFLTKDAKV